MISPSDILNARILIVDDQKANISLLEQMLRSAGYVSVSSTENPRAVYDLHERNCYDLILLDLQMPGMDGFEVMEGLKRIDENGYLPVLVITAQPNHKLRALKAGAKDFVSKPFDLAEVLARVRNMLEIRLLHMETKMLYERVSAEQRLSERLLLNVLPHAIAERLKGRTEAAGNSFTEIIADSFPEVTVLFADIVDFTRFSESLSAEALIGVLNDVFTSFDRIADNRGLEKIKTIGDAYMVAGGIPVARADHAEAVAAMAIEMREAIATIGKTLDEPLAMRVGIHTGPVVAGVIGRSKFIYDLWGDTVNTASRMESHGVAGGIQVSEATYLRLRESFELESRGEIDVKGKGKMVTYLLRGRKILGAR